VLSTPSIELERLDTNETHASSIPFEVSRSSHLTIPTPRHSPHSHESQRENPTTANVTCVTSKQTRATKATSDLSTFTCQCPSRQTWTHLFFPQSNPFSSLTKASHPTLATFPLPPKHQHTPPNQTNKHTHSHQQWHSPTRSPKTSSPRSRKSALSAPTSTQPTPTP